MGKKTRFAIIIFLLAYAVGLQAFSTSTLANKIWTSKEKMDSDNVVDKGKSKRKDIAQVAARVPDDIPIIRRVITFYDAPIPDEFEDFDINDTIWQTHFSGDGKILPPNIDDPICSSIEAGGFRYEYDLDYWPSQPTSWVPTVKYKWEIEHAHVKSKGTQIQTGWTGHFNVILPERVGRYKLKVTLKIYNGKKFLRDEKRTHVLYVLLKQPWYEGSFVGGKTEKPVNLWLDVATTWASGENTEDGVLGALNSSEYDNPFGWGYGVGTSQVGGAVGLIEGRADSGICSDFMNVWRILAACLGIETKEADSYPLQSERYDSKTNPTGLGMVMTSVRPALDNNKSANTLNTVTGVHDRWSFMPHYVGLNKDENTFYDPTFGLKGSYASSNHSASLEGNTFCKVFGDTETKPGPPVKHNCWFLADPTDSVLAWKTGNPLPGWAEWAYVPTEARQQKQKVFNELSNLLPFSSGKDYKEIDQAINHIYKSMASDLWKEDGWHLTKKGSEVFHEEKQAVSKLMKVRNLDVSAIIASLVNIDKDLAQAAIFDAIGKGYDQKKINKAKNEIAKAAKNIKENKFSSAIDHYKKAWKEMYSGD